MSNSSMHNPQSRAQSCNQVTKSTDAACYPDKDNNSLVLISIYAVFGGIIGGLYVALGSLIFMILNNQINPSVVWMMGMMMVYGGLVGLTPATLTGIALAIRRHRKQQNHSMLSAGCYGFGVSCGCVIVLFLSWRDSSSRFDLLELIDTPMILLYATIGTIGMLSALTIEYFLRR